MPNVWPSTGFPNGMVGVSYCQSWDMKTPSTLLEAALGDSATVTVDTLGSTIYIGDWPVDEMDLVEVIGMPSGLALHCDELDPNVDNCMLPGSYLTCAYVDGTTNDPIGIYPIELVINVYTSGSLVIRRARCVEV